jgi:hypothetical protein
MTFETLQDFVKLTKEDITFDNLKLWFSTNEKGYQKFAHDDLVKLNHKELEAGNSKLLLFKNYNDAIKDKEIKLGRIIVNLFFYDIDTEKDLDELLEIKHTNVLKLVNFLDAPFNKKTLGKSNSQIADLFTLSFLDSTMVAMINAVYINRSSWLGYIMTTFVSPTLDIKTMRPSKKIVDYKNKVFKENKKIFDDNDSFKFAEIEKDILKFASKELDDENAQGKLFYDSGFKGDFSNNYKNSSLFRGLAARSDDPLDLNIVKSNLLDGVTKEDLATVMDVAVVGSLGRAIDTRMGGYKTKIFNSAFPSMVIGQRTSNCKSPITIPVTLTADNLSDYRFRFFVEKGKLYLMEEFMQGFSDAENIQAIKAKLPHRDIEIVDSKTLIGKTVQMRTPVYCQSKKMCNTCVGDMFYRLHVVNIGLLANLISGQLMNYSMKSNVAPSL